MYTYQSTKPCVVKILQDTSHAAYSDKKELRRSQSRYPENKTQKRAAAASQINANSTPPRAFERGRISLMVTTVVDATGSCARNTTPLVQVAEVQ
jgi:hypothetical protein